MLLKTVTTYELIMKDILREHFPVFFKGKVIPVESKFIDYTLKFIVHKNSVFFFFYVVFNLYFFWLRNVLMKSG